MLDKLNVYLADLWAVNVGLHNYHWNVVGPNFQVAHEYLEELYDATFEYLDEVAEYARQKGEIPVGNIKEYADLTTIDHIENKEVSQTQAIEGTVKLYKSLCETAKSIHEEAECFILANMMEDQITDYKKEIWFMESMLVDTISE